MTSSEAQQAAHSYWRGLVVGGDVDDVDEVGHPDMGRSFNRIAYRLRRGALSRALDAAGVDVGAARVFEAAYGVGYYLRFWQSRGARAVAGVDVSDRAHQNARRHFPGYDLRQGDLARIGEWDDWSALRGTFDVVTAIDVLYHIVDDGAARAAVQSLAELVAPGGVLMVTEKYAGLQAPHAESIYVVRRPLAWYEEAAGARGLVRERVTPVFWCMDPPAPTAGASPSRWAGYLVWGGMRAALKFWPRNSAAQNGIARVVGTVGAGIDRLAVRTLRSTPNLQVVTFRRPRGG